MHGRDRPGGERPAGGQRPASRPRWGALATALVIAATAVACGGSGPTSAPPSGPVGERLADLTLAERPRPAVPYDRDDWSHWDDVDGDGCDARQEVLIEWATSTPLVDEGRCKVLSGTWVSPFDGAVADVPSDVSVDHLVPLAEAHRAGGWAWDDSEKRAFANDPVELVPTSAEANQSKGSDTPDEWRPPRRESWCAYAERWVEVKDRYRLTVTSAERRALSEMLATCTPASERWPDG